VLEELEKVFLQEEKTEAMTEKETALGLSPTRYRRLLRSTPARKVT
jgi:hypothetical protein